MPVVHLFEQASAGNRDWLDSVYETEGDVSGENVERILEMLDQLGTPKYVQGAATAQAESAMKAADGLGLGGSARETVHAIAEFFVTREK
jgi:geranylgeranyl pyrophosphate synthase